MPRSHPPEFRRREAGLAQLSEKPVAEVARCLGISCICLRNEKAQADIDDGPRPGLSSDERAELVCLRRQKRVLEMEVEILERASTSLGNRPPKMIYAFIVDRYAELPVEVRCRTMKVSRLAFFVRRHAEAYPTERKLADAKLGDLVVKIHERNFGNCGTRRVTADPRLGLGGSEPHTRQAADARASPAAAPRATPEYETAITVRTILCTASSALTARTGCGSKTSTNIARAKAGSTWRSSSTRGPDGWSAGRSRITSAPNWSPTRSTWPSVADVYPPARSPTQITDRTSARGCSANDSAAPACSARWAPSSTRSTLQQ